MPDEEIEIEESQTQEDIPEDEGYSELNIILQGLNSSSDVVRGDTLNALEEMLTPELLSVGREIYIRGLDGVIKGLNDKNYYVRKGAVGVLGRVLTPELLSADRDIYIRGLDSVIKGLNDENYYVKVDGLGRVLTPELLSADQKIYIKGLDGVIKGLNDEDSYARKGAVGVLGRVLTPELLSADREIYIRGLDGVIKGLSDENYHVKDSAVDGLGRVLTPELLSADQKIYIKGLDGVIKGLNDEDSSIRKDVVGVLGRVLTPELLSADQEIYIRGLDGVIKGLSDENYHVKDSVFGVLGRVLTPELLSADREIYIRGLDSVIKDLNDEDYSIRSSAVGSLGRVLTPELLSADQDIYIRGLDGVIECLNDENYYVRKVAVGVLGRVLTPELLLADREIYIRGLDSVIKGLNDETYYVRKGAVGSLGRVLTPELLSADIDNMKLIFEEYPLLKDYMDLQILNSPVQEYLVARLFLKKEEYLSIQEKGITKEQYLDIVRRNPLLSFKFLKNSLNYNIDGSGLNVEKVFLEFREGLEGEKVPEYIVWEEGGRYFGMDKMIQYVSGHPEVSLHSRLMDFGKVIELAQMDGKSPNAFFGGVLNGVIKDNSMYEEGSSYEHFNAILGSFDKSLFTKQGKEKFSVNFSKYSKILEVEGLEYLQRVINRPETMFDSWESFKRVQSILEELNRGELLEELIQLKDQGKEELFNWLKTLAFHRDSKVDINAVREIIKNPNTFLKRGDKNALSEIHQKKLPARYLDSQVLTATELVESLVNGTYDKIQSFQPFEKTYRVPRDNSTTVESLLREALGSRRQGIFGKSQKPGRLFAEISNYFDAKGRSIKTLLSSGVSLEEFWGDDYNKVSSDINNLLFDKEYGLSENFLNERFVKIIAQVHKKSDPMAVIAGDDTACCMAFGTGKNNVYIFNPGIGMFTVRVDKGDGSYRTVAQSVLTMDVDIGSNSPSIVNNFIKGELKKIPESVKENILGGKTYLTCDNIELARNYSGMVPSLRDVYRKFFKEYLSRDENTSIDLESDQIIIGKGHSDIKFSEEKGNTYLPVVPPSYSDNLQKDSFYINLGGESGETEISRKSGVSELSFEDSLSVAVIENEAYSDNEKMQEGLARMMNQIITAQIYNSRNNRPNMSKKYVNEKGKMESYLIAYEFGSDDNKSLYIEDLASRKGSGFSIGKMLMEFIGDYKRNYLEKGDFLPITASARDTTSYRLLVKQLDKIGERLGMRFVMVEEGTSGRGGELMHEIIIRPEKL